MAQERQAIPITEPVHLGFSEQRQPVLRGDAQHHIVARGDQLAFAAEVVRFGFAPDDFALEIARVRGKRDPQSLTPTYAVKVENTRTRRSVTYYGGPGRAWVAEFLADLIAGEFGQP